VSLPLTPSQTVGPFLAIGLPWPDGPFVVPEGTPGAITITGRVLDGAGEPVPDALVETWQAAPDGSFAHPDDPRGPGPAWRPGATAGTGPGAGAAGDLGASVGGGLEAGARPAGTAGTGSSRCGPGRCPGPAAAPRRRTWTCPCSPAGCWTGW